MKKYELTAKENNERIFEYIKPMLSNKKSVELPARMLCQNIKFERPMIKKVIYKTAVWKPSRQRILDGLEELSKEGKIEIVRQSRTRKEYKLK